ncbi:MAG: PqiC family protein, partial [Desulfobulbaceae bacterium]|nr:PqiC family protein [Desulfobulbaceae bacterium]
MSTKHCQRLAGWLAPLLLSVLLLAGCVPRTDPVSYYQLSALEAERSGTATADSDKLVIGIGPVGLPEYLDRPQIVTRLTPNRLHLAHNHRWAEPLGQNIARVLGENLSPLLGTDRILLPPWP